MASVYPNSPVPPQMMATTSGYTPQQFASQAQRAIGQGGAPVDPMGTIAGAIGGMGAMQGPGSLPPQYSTGTYAPQPSQAPAGGAPPPAPMPGYQAPQGAPVSAPQPYSGVPVVVSGTPTSTGASGVTNDSLNALYAMGTGPVDTSALNATNAALQQQMQMDMANAAAYGASSAFGQGGAGTPVQMISANNAANAMIPINAQMQQANLSFYNQQSANQLNALTAAAGTGAQYDLGQQNAALQAQIAQQNALFGANSQNLATQNQAFNQQMMSQDQAMQMYNQMYGMGAGAQGLEQANLDAMYQMYGTSDPSQLIAMMSGQAPMYAQQQQPFNPFSAVQAGMMGYGMAGGFNPGVPQAGSNPNGGSYPVTQMPGGGYVNLPG